MLIDYPTISLHLLYPLIKAFFFLGFFSFPLSFFVGSVTKVATTWRKVYPPIGTVLDDKIFV